jgi:hypothetical protein
MVNNSSYLIAYNVYIKIVYSTSMLLCFLKTINNILTVYPSYSINKVWKNFINSL